MLPNELMIDAFDRIKAVTQAAIKDLSDEDLAFRPGKASNSIAWLIWHLTRIQDDHIADLSKKRQVWNAGWCDKFKLPFPETDTGYGHSPKDVGKVRASAELLLNYHDAVYEATSDYISKLTQADYQKIVDKRWDPPVTIAVRLISVISDNLQHAGQAAYLRGLIK